MASFFQINEIEMSHAARDAPLRQTAPSPLENSPRLGYILYYVYGH